MELFTLDDFEVFDIKEFNGRMAAILTRIRPKLTSMGEELAPGLSTLVDCPLYVHVAKHARRTVNPPDDTWAAFGASHRGYKKDVHFKLAISRHCIRFLFEAGPEYYAKPDWAQGWQREFKGFAGGLKSSRHLAWFRNEHDGDPAAPLADLAPGAFKKLGDELTRRRDGQFVVGRRVDARDFVRLKPKQIEKLALETFEPLAPLFQIHDARLLS
jgi:uncharacterized protein YktB (UPF0637 family)